MLGKELVRHDTKASLLIAVEGGILALVAAIAHTADLRWYVSLPGALGLASLAVSIVILLFSVRPALGGHTGEGWELWSRLDRDNLLIHMRADRRPDRVLFLSRMIHRKFRQLRLAVDLLIVGILLLSGAASIAAVGR
ncbi:Pycsar system effector family protein [Streptomyces rishiriensis]|uniref:Pycsar system effector family protein n=1 Tax=Streptomyces rishiriensis TaxID=68264 RepID=UPI0037BCD6E3